MNLADYRRFTQSLIDRLSGDDRVLGLVAVGSMAEQGLLPDEWSDHDFYVITRPTDQAAFRSDPNWLPNSEQIVLFFQETPHGVKAVYDSGHLLEFAVFDLEELHLAKVNTYRILIDRCDVQRHVEEVRAATESTADNETGDEWEIGQFLTNLLVGVGRHRRGEQVSAHRFVKGAAIERLLTLIHKHVPADQPDAQDNIDPFRRFEQAYPRLGEEVAQALLLEAPQAANALLDLAERALKPHIEGWPAGMVSTLRAFLTHI